MYKRRLAAAVASRPRRNDSRRWPLRVACATVGLFVSCGVLWWAAFVVQRSLASTDVILEDDRPVIGGTVAADVRASVPPSLPSSSLRATDNARLPVSSTRSPPSQPIGLPEPSVARTATAFATSAASEATPTTVSAATDATVAASAASTSTLVPLPPGKRALLFTMDSIADYVRNAAGGGPAGEILVRESLAWGLGELGVALDVATSDAEFARLSARPDDYAAFFLDPWTFVAPGWVPRPFLKGRERRTFLLSFFGLGAVGHGLDLPLDHVLTPYPLGGSNTFLGFAMHPRWMPPGSDSAAFSQQPQQPALPPLPPKKRQGVVWGKKPEYFEGKAALLAAVAQQVDKLVVSVQPGTVPGLDRIPNLVHAGPLRRDEWHSLLAESAFLLGLGDPLLGPSALDAVAAGTVFINPVYTAPKAVEGAAAPFASQHPFLESTVGPPLVCSVPAGDGLGGTLRCVSSALAAAGFAEGGSSGSDSGSGGARASVTGLAKGAAVAGGAAASAAGAASAAAARLAPLLPPAMAPAAYLRRLADILRPVLV